MAKTKNEVSSNDSKRLNDLRDVIPVRGKLLIKALAQKEQKLKSGLLIAPKNEKIEWRLKGRVIAVGEDTLVKDRKHFDVGNIVFFKYFNEDKLEYNGDQYYLVDYPKQVICSFGRKEGK